MKKIIAEYHLTEEETKNLEGKFVGENDFDTLIDFDCDCYTSNGQPLLFFRKNHIEPEVLKTAYLNMIGAAGATTNRGPASGGERKYAITSTGKRSKVTRTYLPGTDQPLAINSGIAGYFDRNAHFDYCRTTAFTKRHLDKFKKAMPLFKTVDNAFKNIVPERHKKQLAMAKATHPNYIIDGTAFTTITINKNYRAAVHTDAGDFEQGFGNLVVYLENVEPVYLILPRFRVAVDLAKNDLLLVDVHQHHGNSEIKKITNDGVRLSFVMYYRKKMYKCLSPTEELERIQRNQRLIAKKYAGVQ